MAPNNEDRPSESVEDEVSTNENFPTPAGLPDDLAELAEEENGSTDPDEIAAED